MRVKLTVYFKNATKTCCLIFFLLALWTCSISPCSTDCWRNRHLQRTAHLLWSCVSLVTHRFVPTVCRSQQTFSSYPDSKDILRFIAPFYWLNPRWERLARRQVVLLPQRRCRTEEFAWEALAISQEGTKGESSTGAAWALPHSRLTSLTKGPNLSKKAGKEGRNCTSLCPHSVSPLLHVMVHS